MTSLGPLIPYSAWKPTCESLHLWTQVAGKIRLALTPWLNHSWHVTLMAEAYSHEVSSAGFWPGDGGVDHACFYSYAYPMPHGFKDAPVDPKGAFLQSTYEAAAETAHWDRAALETRFA